MDHYIHDVTERKRLEALRDEVERITQHDLKGPLMGILNLPKLIRNNGELNKRQQLALDGIEKAGFRMIEMINMSLNLFKIEAGIYTLLPRPVNLGKLIAQVVAELEGIALQNGVSVRINGDKNKDQAAGAVVIGGEEWLCFTLFQNLIKNAIEASSHGDDVDLFWERQEHSILVHVHNTGVVPSEILPVFFEKYTTAGKKMGTGPAYRSAAWRQCSG